jgi:cytochrome c oxidase subunit 2
MTSFAWRCAVIAAFFGVAGYFTAAIANGATGAERIALTAKKFEFSAKEIRLKKGKPVTFALTTPDFPHGFNVPDFNVRADLIPGKTVEVTFTPDRAGRFAFLCDNFCGEGHDNMSGFLVVTDN